MAKELTKAISAFLEKLPTRTREIFMLSRYNGLKKNRNSRSGITTKSVEYQITCALKQWRSDLAKDYLNIFCCLNLF